MCTELKAEIEAEAFDASMVAELLTEHGARQRRGDHHVLAHAMRSE